MLKFPDNIINSILQSFVDGRGLRNANLQVQSRAKYLFLKFVKPLKDRLSTFVDGLYSYVKDMIEITLPTDQELLQMQDFSSDRLFLYETIGSLLASQRVSSETRVSILQQIFTPINARLDEILSQKLYLSDTPEKPRFTRYIHSLINAIGTLSKGFDDSSSKKIYLKDGVDFFKHFLVYVTRVHSEMPMNKSIQTIVIFYYHRMIELMNEEVLEIIPETLSHLYQTCHEIYQLKDILILLGQLMQKFKEKVFNIVNEMFGPIINKLFPMIKNGNYDFSLIGSSEEMREIADLHKAYFTFIQTILLSGLKQVLISESK